MIMLNPHSAQLQSYFIKNDISFTAKQVNDDTFFYLTHQIPNGPEVTLSVMLFKNRAIRLFLYDFIRVSDKDKLLPVLQLLNDRHQLGVDYNCYIDNDCDIIIQYDYSVGEDEFSPSFTYELCKRAFDYAQRLHGPIMKILLNVLH